MDAKCCAYGEELELVEVFKYLGRLITFNDDDIQAVRGKLKKGRARLRADLARSARGKRIRSGMRDVLQVYRTACPYFRERDLVSRPRHS